MGEDSGRGIVRNTSEFSLSSWLFTGIIVLLALGAIAYLIFAADSKPSTTTPAAPAASSAPAVASSAAK